jgi:DNA-binding response OmpR family regulator
MTALFLLISTPALRDAVQEQIVAAKIQAPRLAQTAQELQKLCDGAPSCVVVIDHAAYDKKVVADLAARADKPIVLLLGEAEDIENIAETFDLPLRLGHLISRLRFYLETAPLLRNRAVNFGRFRLEPQNRRVVSAAIGEVLLTEKETALLAFLAHSAEPVTRREILAEVWGYDERIDTHTLETHIYQLRRKLDAGGENWLINEAGAYHLSRGES